MIASHPWQQAWLVDPLPQRLDPDFTLTQRLVCTPAEAIATLPAGPAQPPWHTLARLQQRTRQGIERYTAEFSELGCVIRCRNWPEGRCSWATACPPG
ncbi:hypothetical protein HAALTHF_15390n [Vreelandella aquamarina]|nr:hypothetical protein HAALTHF_15390n [Halomonas axialensis]